MAVQDGPSINMEHMYETMSESRKRRGSRHLMWPSKKIIHMHSRLKFWRRQLMIFLCTQYLCTLFMLHRCLWPYIYILILILILIYIYINTNMNINIIDYNGISIWTMCSKTKSWKTHYVTRGLGAPLFNVYERVFTFLWTDIYGHARLFMSMPLTPKLPSTKTYSMFFRAY